MIEAISTHQIIVIAIAAVLGLLVGLLIGSLSRLGSADSSSEAALSNELLQTKSRISGQQNEIKGLNIKLEKYLHLAVTLPEIVKNINSNLSYDDLINAIIRMTKTLMDTNAVELYVYNDESKKLSLTAAFGTKRGQRIEFAIGEGIIGTAADAGMTVTKDQIRMKGAEGKSDVLTMASPIQFKKNLLGVLAVGKIKNTTGNERRLLAMVTDLAGIALKNTELLSAVKKDAITDPLTGLFNRRHFEDMGIEACRKAANYEQPLSIFIFDIDNFKNYNDTNGHAEGDKLLRELGAMLKKHTRSTNVVARFGGEEFIVLLNDTNRENAMMYAEGIRKMIESHPFTHREKQPLGCVSISGGVAAYPNDGDSMDAVIRLADKSLYAAKESGRNRILLHGE